MLLRWSSRLILYFNIRVPGLRIGSRQSVWVNSCLRLFLYNPEEQFKKKTKGNTQVVGVVCDEMANWVKSLQHKPEDLSLILGNHIKVEET